MRRILFYVQHLMGVGHVFRASRIVAALAVHGFDVHLAYGGARIPHFDAGGATIHYLPPLRAGTTTFAKLETPDGVAVDEAYKDDRRDRLLALYRALDPQMIVTEAFPFGRRQMRFELMPLLEAAAAAPRPPVVVASVRDILQENRKPERDLETLDILQAHYGHVLVHADPGLVRLEATFPHHAEIADRLLYTGIVAPPRGEPGAQAGIEPCDVIVSVGGGVMGSNLLLAALAARRLSSLRHARWRVVTGVNVEPEVRAKIARLATDGVEVHEFLRDLRGHMAAASLSISRAGYNTVADIFRSGARAIVVPLSDGEETEQLRRAGILEEKALATVVMPEAETAEGLAAAIDRAAAAPAPDYAAINLEGAETSAKIIAAILEGAPLDGWR